MIASIITGSGNNRRVHALPSSRDERIKVGNILKSNLLFKDSRSFKQAKARGVVAIAAHKGER